MTTLEEVIQACQQCGEDSDCEGCIFFLEYNLGCILNYLDEIPEALEKMHIKKPETLDGFDKKALLGKCECGAFISGLEKFCSQCGQALDWSDTE